MDKYEQISVVGEGSYGLVMKCRHKETDQLVAIKKFLETEEDATIRKMALREIRMLRKLKHENLVAMLEVFRHKKRFYLVFEYVEGTVLDELEKMPNGLGEEGSKERIFQVVRAINYCHYNNIIHRDVKPENVLVSSRRVVKLCDFGFARLVTLSGEPCTEYVATRWYRAPELLVGDANYGSAVDIWAIGCLFSEMITGDPLFPGESDIDQLYLIVKMLGKPCGRHQQLMSKNSHLRGMMKSACTEVNLKNNFPNWSLLAVEFLSSCLKMEPNSRATTDDLLKHPFFTHDRFPQKFLPILRERVNAEFNENPLLRKIKTEILMSTDKKVEERTRKVAPNEQVRWKFNYDGGSIKRKLDQDLEKNLISLSKTSERLNVLSKNNNNNNNKNKPKLEMEMLEKSMESLNKLNRNHQDSSRPSSEKNSLAPPSPPHFQSLQQFGSSHHNVLHPTINNISFKEPPVSRRLPQPQQQQSSSVVPQIQSSRTQFLKKLERTVVVDNIFNASIEAGLWYTMPKKSNKPEKEKKADNFTLPNLPGVTGSPLKNGKKKMFPDISEVSSNSVTPAYRYKKAKRKLNILDITLPLSVKDK